MIYFLTGNQNKIIEAKAIINDLNGYDIDLPEIQDIDARKVIKEKLLEGLKYKNTGLIVEDTSLYLDALNGFPGPLIKWFLKAIGTAGIYNVTVKLGNNKAWAKTIIGYAKDLNDIEYFEGAIEGVIVAPAGNKGFGWDSIFKPLGYDKTFAEMDTAEKNLLSMRKIAFLKLKEKL